MKFFDLVQISIKDIKSQKSRVIFTIIGVSVGIGAILFFVSLGFGLQKNILNKITTESSLLTLDIAPTDNQVVRLNDENLAKIRNIPGVDEISPEITVPSQISLDNINSEVTANIVNADYFDLNGIAPNIGRVFKKSDEEKIVVNPSVVELLNLKSPKDILGKQLRIILFISQKGKTEVQNIQLNKNFQVVGVLGEQGESPQIYVKRQDIDNLPINEYQFAKIKVKQSRDLEPVRNQLISMGFTVSALLDTVDQANKIFRVIQIILGFFGIIALIVAAIGLANTMTITLLERTNEIGVMRAIGAAPKDIELIFLDESTITGFLGGLLGIGIGIGAGELFNGFINVLAKYFGGASVNIFYYPFWFIVFIIILSTSVGIVAGLGPAKRAAKLNPLKALRYK